MRTSIDIPDDLMKKAKIKAVEDGISFKDLVIRSLSKELELKDPTSEAPWEELKGKGSASGLTSRHSGFDG
ncbi:hypothetical protein [Gracilimonas mengyeensis]|uniref:Antitoxin VapB n=1 Tax=Gracilimonas mengyeensis TaxID=1302730 RepID=A0A521BYV2_9BACT|nr:hypothetical protein [Gracilimonas mengyeensis]SMO52353.1 hypothetical protein SAMN06265219_10415 [Gracilimonas mengyeensis]